MIQRFLIIILILSMVPPPIEAGELRDLYRGARMSAMGGAYVGLADDEQAIFVNPAGMAGIQKQAIHYMVTDIDLSSDIYSSYRESADAFKSFSLESMNALMGKNVYGRLQMTPSFVMPNFGIAGVIDAQGHFLLKTKRFRILLLVGKPPQGFKLLLVFHSWAGGGEGVQPLT